MLLLLPLGCSAMALALHCSAAVGAEWLLAGRLLRGRAPPACPCLQGKVVRGRMLVCADGSTSRLATQLGYCTAPPEVRA